MDPNDNNATKETDAKLSELLNLGLISTSVILYKRLHGQVSRRIGKN
jgi:hypothetical protein